MDRYFISELPCDHRSLSYKRETTYDGCPLEAVAPVGGHAGAVSHGGVSESRVLQGRVRAVYQAGGFALKTLH